MHNLAKRALMGASLLAMAAGAPAMAQAQDTSQGASLEEIVVTAQRRQERLQDVPIAITAVTATALTNAGINSNEGLMLVVPGLNMGRAGGKSVQPYIRGIGISGGATGTESPAATYVDGVYYADLQGALFSLNNIARVEVLKGPQGTLFGRNATGGLISIVTRDPSSTESVEGSVAYGNYDTWEVSAYATGGNDIIAGDFAAYVLSQDKGFGRNIVTGRRANWRQDVALRTKWVFTPSDVDRVVVAADYFSSKGDYGITSNVYPGSVLIGGFTAGNFFDRQGNFHPSVPKSDHRTVSARYEHTFDWGQLTTISAYRRDITVYNIDQDNGAVRVADTTSPSYARMLQQEAFLTGDTGKFNWTAGVFLMDLVQAYTGILVRGSAGASNTNLWAEQGTKSYAGYFQTTYSLTDKTKFTAGIRYTIDKREFQGVQTAGPTNPRGEGTALAQRNETATSKRPSWRLSLDHKFTPDILGYVSYNRGFKSGTFNLTSLTSPVLQPETLDAYEVGVKSEFFDNSLRFNAAAFYYDYKQIQLNRTVPGGTQLFNAASGRIKGFDADLQYAPPISTGRLVLTAGFEYLHNRYLNFPAGPINIPQPGTCTPTPQQLPGPRTGGNLGCSADLSGKIMARSPKFTYSLSGDYSVDVGAGELSLNLSWFHSSSLYWEPENRLKQPAYDVVNGQVAFAFGSDNQYKVRAFGRNLLDKHYISNGASSTLGDNFVPALPRTYGIGFDFKY